MVARLERLEQAAAGEPALAATLVEDMRDEIKCAGIDPRKGRMKDLVRLKRLLDSLCGELPGGGR
jgi:phage tail tape-measure protein